MIQNDEIDRAVLRYLGAHPSAADTLEGITEWWLERRRVAIAVDVISAALVRLIEQGVVEEFPRVDSSPPLPPLFRIASRQT